jgi:HTH-type transcriptional regulator/antitoxin HigA
MIMEQWFLIENESDYKKALERFQKIKVTKSGTLEHKEKMLLVTLLQQYEASVTNFPVLDPIELIKIRMEDFGFQQNDLANEYGDKGTISKVLNYKKPLSLNMIRIFSKKLRIPANLLIQEYELAS